MRRLRVGCQADCLEPVVPASLGATTLPVVQFLTWHNPRDSHAQMQSRPSLGPSSCTEFFIVDLLPMHPMAENQI
ncbi:hypothetical protein GRJ2_000279100 [Grus japonensis]|uniref:Uncharacterized protein n=1 Tax=Grus japonensis TaxID=30415 RepID=A0ABC9VZ73_GRUJA